MTKDQITTLVLVILLLLLFLLMLWLFLRRRRRRRTLGSGGGGAGRGDGAGGRSGNGPTEAELREAAERAARERAAREAQERAAAAKVRDVLAQADPLLAERMLRQAGARHGPLSDVSDSAESAMAIAKAIGPQAVETFWLAATQKDISFDLKRESERVPVHYPTSDVEPVAMADMAQLPHVLPEQLMMSDEQFYPALAGQELTVLQPFARRESRKRLYILLDVSGSMEDPMANGMPRHVWARGVTVNLLLEALRGDAEYLLRPFDGQCHELKEVATPADAERVIDHVLTRGFSGNGTNILHAVQVAVRDIRKRGEGVERSELLLITDGDDKSMDDTAKVKEVLGEDVRLHVVQIGRSTDALQRAAVSHRSFS